MVVVPVLICIHPGFKFLCNFNERTRIINNRFDLIKSFSYNRLATVYVLSPLTISNSITGASATPVVLLNQTNSTNKELIEKTMSKKITLINFFNVRSPGQRVAAILHATYCLCNNKYCILYLLK